MTHEKIICHEEMKLLNPCVDAVFKALFTSNSDDSRSALLSFVSAVLGRKVSNIVLQPNELPIDTFGEKQSCFDITCILDGKEPANIEIQTYGNEKLFRKRVEYYSAHLLNHYVEKGKVWREVPKTYQISVVDFIFDADSESYMSKYEMRSKDGRTLSSRQNIIVIELPKIERLGMKSPENLTNIEKWGKFFIDSDDPKRQGYMNTIAESEAGIKKARKVLVDLNADYSMWSAQERHNNAILEREMLKREMAEQKAKAIAEASAKALAEGRAVAITETAHNLKNLGVSVDLIIKATGLTAEQINML